MNMRIFHIILQALFIVCVPVFLITTNVRLVLNSGMLYDYGFNKYKIEKYTGIEYEQLQIAGQQIRDYFNNDEDKIKISISVHGSMVSNLFNEKEILHMYDVKQLVKMVYSVQLYAAISIIIACLLLFVDSSRKWKQTMPRYFMKGGWLTFSVVLFVALLAVVGFDRLFLYFHLVSFSNDLWILDPRHDYLIAMFPQGFFFDSTVAIAILTLLEGAFLGLLPRLIQLLKIG
ncbi:MAG: TIGR01906 family membrane protein [Dehalococcoidia bacterium]|tara:strand:+ start:1831 stop:2523 length:693 start_codon:yes stop_codon:yes gene_type:complete